MMKVLVLVKIFGLLQDESDLFGDEQDGLALVAMERLGDLNSNQCLSGASW